METNQNKHRRRSIRLQFYDYSASGAYFVTVCTQERRCLFGDAVDGVVQLNDAGRAVERTWLAIPRHFPHIDLDAFVVMPNHVHGVIIIGDRPVGAKDFSPLHNTSQPGRRPSGALPKTIGSIVRGFKIGVTKWIRDNTDTYAVWQRNYYEHVIRSDESLVRIRQYIFDNPARWAFDRENPAVTTLERDEDWPS